MRMFLNVKQEYDACLPTRQALGGQISKLKTQIPNSTRTTGSFVIWCLSFGAWKPYI